MKNENIVEIDDKTKPLFLEKRTERAKQQSEYSRSGRETERKRRELERLIVEPAAAEICEEHAANTADDANRRERRFDDREA